MEIASARLLMLHTAWRIDRGEPAREGISMVKVQASETLGRVADRAVQVFGGAGYCKDQSIERIYRDARIFRIYDGTSEIHRGIIARGLLERGPVIEWLGKLATSAGFRSFTFEKTRDRNTKWKNRKHRVPLCEGRLWVEG